jgi:hypothetical protein
MLNNNVPGKVWDEFGNMNKNLSLFVVLLYVMMGQNHRKIVNAFCTDRIMPHKECQLGYSI